MTSLKFTTGSVTDRGLNPRRTANEDRLLVLSESGLFLVADGVGGHRGGQVASQTAVDVFTEVFQNRPAGDVLSLVKETIKFANESIFKAAHELPELEGMASTLTVVAIDGMRAVIAHVGDSRVYRCDGKNLICETEDHSEVNDAVRAGVLTPAQAENHPHRNIINRALGADARVEADLKLVTIDDRTSFLLCSDGVTRHIPDEELQKLMLSGAHPNNICTQIKEICFARGAEDNLTAVIVDCGERAYVEDATRPVVGKTTPLNAFAAAPQSSRISVDFSAAPTSNNVATNKAKPTGKTRSKTLINGLIQLVLLLVGLAAVFYVGRNWEKIYSRLSGQPVSANPTNSGAQPEAPVVNPDVAAAKALFEERRYDKAMASYTKLLETDPNNAEFHYLLGRSQLEQKQYPEALKHLNEAARLDEKLPNIFAHLALAYEAIGDKKNASLNLKKAASINVTPITIPSPTRTPAR